SIGAMVGPEAFTEVRYIAHDKQLRALDLIPDVASEFSERFGRSSGGLFHVYRAEDADTILVTLGSVTGTAQEAVDALRAAGLAVGVVWICAVRPFPARERGDALKPAQRIVVVEKSLAVGFGGVVATHIRMALQGIDTHVYTVIAGLGGRPI